MLLLTPYFDPSLVRSEDLVGIENTNFDKLAEFFNGLYENAGSRNCSASINTESARDAEGNVYRDVQFVVTGKFSRNGERFFAGAGMAVSLDGMLVAVRLGLDWALAQRA